MTEAIQKKRVDYIDIAKGLGILFVVLGHCLSISEGLNRFIFSFHMPLFFILSGYTFSRKNCENIKNTVLKSFKQLVLPYLLSAAIIIFLKCLQACIQGSSIRYELIRWVMAAIYGSGSVYPSVFDAQGIPMTFIGAIWFLLAMFFARILMSLFLKSKSPLLWVMISFFVGYITAHKVIWLPFSIQAGMCAVFFMYIGFLIKEKNLFEWTQVHWILKLLMLFVWIYCAIFCGRLWMVSNVYSDGFIDIIGSICGTFVIVYISKLLEKISLLRKILCWLGKCSMGILCAHVISWMCWPMDFTTGWIMRKIPVSYGAAEIFMQFFAAALVTAVLYFCPWIKRKMFPTVNEKK